MMINRMQCESMSSPNVILANNDPRRPKVAEAAAAITLHAHTHTPKRILFNILRFFLKLTIRYIAYRINVYK